MVKYIPRHSSNCVIKSIICFCLMLITAATGGCWDMRELQDRSFVSALAVDLAEEGLKQGQTSVGSQVESFVQGQGKKKYRLSLQVVKLTPTKGNEGPAASSNTYVVSTTGESMLEMIRDMLGQSSKGLYFEHLDAIVISESAVRLHGLVPILDIFIRDPEMRRRIKVLITPGEARKLIEFKPPTGETGGRFLTGIVGNQKKNMHVGGARTDIGFISQALDNGNDAMAPRVELTEGILKVGGLAVFRKDQFVGFIDEYTVQGLKFIGGTPKSAAIAITCPEHPWSTLVFEMYIHETLLRPHAGSDGGIFFTLDISMWGSVGEVMCSNRHNLNKPEFLRQMEQLVASEVKKNCLHTLHVLQQKKVDSARLGGKIRAYLPKEWKNIKEEWREIYPSVPMQVSVNVVIRSLGEHR